MRTTTIDGQIVCLTNGIIWDGRQLVADPEECDPFWVMAQHFDYTAQLNTTAQRETRLGSLQDERAFELRHEWAQSSDHPEDQFIRSIQL